MLLGHRDRAAGCDRYETGLSVLANTKFGGNWAAEALLVALTNRTDWVCSELRLGF